MENMCSDLGVLQAISIVKKAFDVVIVVVPVILTISIMIALSKAVLSDDDNYGALVSASLKKLIIAAMIAFLPNLIITIFSYSVDSLFNKDFLCLEAATDEKIALLKIVEEEQQKAQAEATKTEQTKQAEQEKIKEIKEELKDSGGIDPATYISSTFTPIVNGVQRPVEKGECMHWEDQCYCPNLTNAKGFQFIMQDETTRTFKETTALINAEVIEDKCGVISNVGYITVAKDVAENYKQALELLCKLKNEGINGYKINSIRTNGTYAMRMKADRKVCSPHSYGIAIDFSSGVSINYNGKEYDPYTGQGPNTKQNYTEFINAIGGENSKENINYIVWKYAFEPAGFEWGGEWNDYSFDPMHYEVKR